MSEYKLELDIQAAEDGSPQVVKMRGVAYSGGDIMQWRGAMVVDLAGMQFAQQIPLMNSHCNDPSCKLGEVAARVEDNKLLVEGVITSQSEAARQIIADGRLSKWQLSIGAGILGLKNIDENEKVTVNGIEFNGPLTVVTRSMLREVSVVAIGADRGASMEIVASLCLREDDTTGLPEGGAGIGKQGEIQMNENENNKVIKNGGGSETAAPQGHVSFSEADIQAAAKEAADKALKAERERRAKIREICAGEYPEIQAKAEDENWDENKLRAALLDAMRNARPATGVNVNTGVKAIGKSEIEAALCLREGLSADELVKSYGEKTVDAAMGICDISLKEVVRECIKLNGGTPIGTVGINEDDIRASFSTVSLPGILSNVANKVLLRGYNMARPAAPRLCSEGNLNDFKESERFRITDMGDLLPVAPDGEIKEGGVSEEKATNRLDTYGKKFCLTRQMIINDDLGAFTKIPQAWGGKAAKLVDKLFFSRLEANPTQADGVALFHANHRNLISSSGTFGKTGLEKAIELFENQKDADGTPIAATAAKLLVPTALKFAAKELLGSAMMVATGTTDALKPAYNVLSDENLEIISSPYLTSAANWYLFANPAEIDTFEIGYLKGRKTPTIQQGDTDFNTLGMWFRVFFDVGVREQDFRGMVKSIG